jgi:hypothetical protein
VGAALPPKRTGLDEARELQRDDEAEERERLDEDERDEHGGLELASGLRVAGHADVLIVPNIEAGNMLAKDLIFVSGAASAGLVVGASVPIILTSRADSVAARLASCAIACLDGAERERKRVLF